MKLSNPRLFYKNLFYTWGFLILVVSSIPNMSIPLPSRFTPDKVAHFLEYFIFSGLFCLYLFYSGRSERKIILLTLILILFAYLDELHQKFIPGRQFSIHDFIADFLGIVCGWSILYFMNKKKG